MPLNGLEFLKLTFVDIDSGTILKSRNTSTRSSTDRAFDFGSKGWGFKSLRVRQTKTTKFVYPKARTGRTTTRPALDLALFAQIPSLNRRA